MTALPGPNWYDVLDVDPAASAEEIRDAWREAIADLTPADRRFRLYNQAAEVLLDPERRAAHDADLAREADDQDHDAPGTDAEPDAEHDETDAGPGEEPIAPAPGEPAASSRSPRAAVPVWLLAAVAILAALSVAAMSYLFTQPSEASVAQATTGGRNAAERAAVTVLSYDYETLPEDQQAAHAVITSDYRKRYDELFAVIEENAPSTRTKVEVDVVASSVVRASPTRVQVLLFLDRPTTNRVTEEPVVYKDQATLTMERVDGEWLVDDVQTSPAQS